MQKDKSKKDKTMHLSYLYEVLRKRSMFPRFGILIVLVATFRIHPSGDTHALLNGLNHALGYLSDFEPTNANS